MTVVDEEFGQLRRVLGCNASLPPSTYWTRRVSAVKNYDVVLKQLADRGNLASNEGAREVIEDFRPHYLLLVGIGGGVQGRDDVGVGDVIVADYVDYYEFRKLEGGKSLQRRFPFDHPSKLLRFDMAKSIIDGDDWTTAISSPRPVEGR